MKIWNESFQVLALQDVYVVNNPQEAVFDTRVTSFLVAKVKNCFGCWSCFVRFVHHRVAVENFSRSPVQFYLRRAKLQHDWKVMLLGAPTCRYLFQQLEGWSVWSPQMQAPKSLVSCASHTKHSQVTGAVAQQPDMEKKKVDPKTRKWRSEESVPCLHIL